jgi:photosystem II stability/assembly factor-like uncharacterized protein
MNTLLVAATKKGIRIYERSENRWREIFYALAAHHVTSVSVQGASLLVGATDGILCSEDWGQTWYRPDAGLSVPHVRWVSYHPRTPGVALAGTEPAAIFRTTDNAHTWQACPEVDRLRDELGWYLPYSPEAGCVRDFAFADYGRRVYAAVEQGGLLRSDDAGESWHLVEGSPGNPHIPLPTPFIHNDVHSVAVRPTSPDQVTASTGGGLYRSGDGGQTWSHLYDCYCRAVWLDPGDPSHIIFGPATGVDESGRIEESLNGGASWHGAAEGLSTPWPHHMVERMLQVDDELLAVLSNGHVIATDLAYRAWRRILPERSDVVALAVGQAVG